MISISENRYMTVAVITLLQQLYYNSKSPLNHCQQSLHDQKESYIRLLES